MASAGANLPIIRNGVPQEFDWGARIALTSLITSMTVNALVTGLIVFRIFKVFREVKSVTTLEDQSLSITRGNKLRSVTFILIESGMALFAIQLARVIITIPSLLSTDTGYDVLESILAIHEMVNVIMSSVIVTTFCLLITSI